MQTEALGFRLAFGVAEVLVEPGAGLVAVPQKSADEGAAGVLLLLERTTRIEAAEELKPKWS